jgi:hypothetical protein
MDTWEWEASNATNESYSEFTAKALSLEPQLL